MTLATNTVEFAPSAPVARPRPVSREEYAATICPLCVMPMQQRIRGIWCPRCRGWLVEELREGVSVRVLWQGRP